MTVQVIRATKTMQGPSGEILRREKLRVAAYCRVSTDSREQESSYETQCRHYMDYIRGNPDWELAGIYADEGISGTSTKGRDRFNEMIADCGAGKIDMILTKSISRWARNTIDSLRNIRKLRDLGIPVLFEKENINTMDAKGEVLITIMSSLAQQESDSLSRNVKMGIRYLYQQGRGRLNTAQFLGLTRGEEKGSFVIVPEEAVLVRRIYREYLEGLSPGMIASRLSREEIPSPAGKATWYSSTIESILENEKYCGDLLMQKYFVKDFLTHEIVKNEGQLPRYYVADAFEPIVPRQIHRQVQQERQRRALLKHDPARIRFGSSKALTGRIVCGICGRKLKRCADPDPLQTDWRCLDRAWDKRKKGREPRSLCSCRRVPEQEARAVILEALNQLPRLREDLIRMQEALDGEAMKRLDGQIEALGDRKKRLQENLACLAPGSRETDALKAELEEAGEEHAGLTVERAEHARREMQVRLLLELADVMTGKPGREEEGGRPPACHDREDFFRRTRYLPPEDLFGPDGRLLYFSDDLVIRCLDRLTVAAEGYEVELKAGIRIYVAGPRKEAAEGGVPKAGPRDS